MQTLWKYELEGNLTNQNAGYSMWGFAKRDGKDYFVKQFLSPKYPYDDTVSSPERLQKRKAQCEAFVCHKRAIYNALNEYSNGNDVRVCDFFRVESRYYIAMEKINALPWMIEDIVALPLEERKRLCAIVAYAVAGLHRGHLIHADLKHENILYTHSRAGLVTAKVIDFDSSFLESSPPLEDEEIVGDFNYFSPEVCSRMNGFEVPLTCKLDIFALGVLFHQYFAGELPGFDHDAAAYAGDAVYQGLPLTLSDSLPIELRELLERMLSAYPERRPSAWEVYIGISGCCELMQPNAYPPYQPAPKPIPQPVPQPAPQPVPEPVPQPTPPAKSGSPFYSPGGF